MRLTSWAMASAVLWLAFASTTSAAVITTLNEGDDWTIVRSGVTTENRILVKNTAGASNNDRIGVAQFSGYSLGPVTVASVRFDLERTAGVNNFVAGESISLWGVPDLNPNENITQSVTWSTLTTNGIILGDASDGTNNNVMDSALAFLGSITFTGNTSGDMIDFFGSAVTAFVQADTNNLMTFLLTAEGDTNVNNTPLFYNEDSAFIATEFYPSVMTNEDAVIPEPASLGLAAITFATAMMCRRRRKS
ncbi:MAG: hypothetical protein KF847_20170 [Pirellulales bacterium]|nr:hypothetical protein [Pirellulales bacterium]